MTKSFLATILCLFVIASGYAQDDSQSSVSDSLSPGLSGQNEDSVIEQEISDFIADETVETTGFQEESSPITQAPTPGVPTPINGQLIKANSVVTPSTPFISGELNTIAPGNNAMSTPFVQPGCINGTMRGPISNTVSYPIGSVPTPIVSSQPRPVFNQSFSTPVNNFSGPAYGNVVTRPGYNNFGRQCCPQYSRGFRGGFFRRVR